MHRHSITRSASIVIACSLILGCLALPQNAHAVANYNVTCSVAALKAAINNANTDGDDSVLNLAAGCDYAVTSIDNVNSGNNGLPTIDADGNFTINGNNATIRRNSGTRFRMFVVSLGVDTVTINGLNVTDFYSTDGDPCDDGGAILALTDGDCNSGDGGANFVINNSFFENNQTDDGGRGACIFTKQGAFTVTGSTFQYNTANGNQAGALYTIYGNVSIYNSTFQGNTADGNQGGAIYASNGNVMVEQCIFRDNTANGNQGGAIQTFGDDVIVIDSIFENNEANGNQGGAIYSGSNGQMTVAGCTFTNNRAIGNQGGAIYSGDDGLHIIDSTFRDNQTEWDGGAIYSRAEDINLLNCTFFGNTTGPNSDNEGGAIYSSSSTNLNITNCTFVNNTDGDGNTFNDNFSTLTMKNTIVKNDSGDICAAAATGGQNNLLSDNSCGAGAPFNLGAVTNLLPLDDYGGPTETFALGQGSNAIDAVTDCTAVSSGTNPLFSNGDAITTDQRGASRPNGASCDIGAFEGDAGIPVPTVSQWGVIVLALLLSVPALRASRHRQKKTQP